MSLSSIASPISDAVSALVSLIPPTPDSQKAGDKPITFALVDLNANKTLSLDMVIRPEELTRTDVSRATVQQTLGGAWVDDFGPGMATINISGHTGWRMNAKTNPQIAGVDQFAKLKQVAFTGWHTRRNTAVKAGNDPAKVELFFIDTLNTSSDLVVPMNFTLRRSRSRPLLAQFSISMLVIAPQPPKSQTAASSNALTSLLSSIKKIISTINGVINVVKGIVGQVTSFMLTATSIFQSVGNLIANVESIPQSLLGAAKGMAQAGTTLFATLASTAGNTTAQSAAMSTASDFENILCLLNNAVNRQQTYPDYTPLYGSSNCSSTSGGSPISPYADTNPFYAVMGVPQYAAPPTPGASTAPAIATPTTPSPMVNVTPTAQQALALINHSDPVLAPMSTASLGLAAATIAAGVSVK